MTDEQRLNQPPGKGHNAPPPPTMTRECLECGKAFDTPKRTPGLFCCRQHKAEFQNRRQVRGAILYDLIMAWRYDRKVAGLWKVLTMLCRMATDFRQEDREQREGRPSWRNPKVVLSRHPHLQSVATNIRRKSDQ